MPWGAWEDSDPVLTDPAMLGMCITTGLARRQDAGCFTAAYDAVRAGTFDELTADIYDNWDNAHGLDYLITSGFMAVGGAVTHWRTDDETNGGDGTEFATGRRTQMVWVLDMTPRLDTPFPPAEMSNDTHQWAATPETFNRWGGFSDDERSAVEVMSAEYWPQLDGFGDVEKFYVTDPGVFRMALLPLDAGYEDLTHAGADPVWVPGDSGITIASCDVTYGTVGPIPLDKISDADFAAIATGPRIIVFAEYHMPNDNGHPDPLPGERYVPYPKGVAPIPLRQGFINWPQNRRFVPMLRTVGGPWGLPSDSMHVYQRSAVIDPRWPAVQRIPDA